MKELTFTVLTIYNINYVFYLHFLYCHAFIKQFVISSQDIFLTFDKNKTKFLEYREVEPALKAAGRTEDTHK